MADKQAPRLEYLPLSKGPEVSVRDRLVGRFWISLALFADDLPEVSTKVRPRLQ